MKLQTYRSKWESFMVIYDEYLKYTEDKWEKKLKDYKKWLDKYKKNADYEKQKCFRIKIIYVA